MDFIASSLLGRGNGDRRGSVDLDVVSVDLHSLWLDLVWLLPMVLRTDVGVFIVCMGVRFLVASWCMTLGNGCKDSNAAERLRDETKELHTGWL